MELGIVLAVVAVLAIVAALGAHVVPRLKSPGDDPTEFAWMLFQQVADDVGGLVVVRTDQGWPRLKGVVDGVEIEIDQENDVAFGLEGMLGLRCSLPEAIGAPNAAIWIGEVATLHSQFGRPRALGDMDALFEVYTRVEPSASDWWQEPDLVEALKELPGVGLLLYDGALTVVFSDLDEHSVRAACRVPQLIVRGVERVTLH